MAMTISLVGGATLAYLIASGFQRQEDGEREALDDGRAEPAQRSSGTLRPRVYVRQWRDRVASNELLKGIYTTHVEDTGHHQQGSPLYKSYVGFDGTPTYLFNPRVLRY